MGGDELVTKWIGDVAGDRALCTSTPARFADSSMRFRTFKIMSRSLSTYAYIGKYNATPATFANTSFLLGPGGSATFEYIDIYELGYMRAEGTDLAVNWIGINLY